MILPACIVTQTIIGLQRSRRCSFRQWPKSLGTDHTRGGVIGFADCTKHANFLFVSLISILARPENTHAIHTREHFEVQHHTKVTFLLAL